MYETSNASSSLTPSLYDDDEYYDEEEGCDESRCVSRGRTNLHNGSFTCYGDDGTYFRRMCADGFLPVVVEDEPPTMSARLWNTPGATLHRRWDYTEDVPVRYFTCCPPRHAAVLAGDAVARRCSDPVGWFETETARGAACVGTDDGAGTAAGALRMHPRRMKPDPIFGDFYIFGDSDVKWEEFFLCCDEPLETDNGDDDNDNDNGRNQTTYIQDTQCVPYRDDVYYFESRIRSNRIGYMWNFMSCDFQGGGFPVVSPLSLSREGNDDNPVSAAAQARLFQCCRDGPGIQSVWIRDSAFWITWGIPFFFFAIAVMVSAVLFLSLLIPALTKRTNGTNRMASSRTTRRNNNAVTGDQRPYSPFNLYLVYLAFWDFVSHTAVAVNFGMVLTGKTHSFHYMPSLLYQSYVLANLWINAFIAHQVLVLLQSSHEARRIVPVRLTRVNLECVAASIIASATILSMEFFPSLWIVFLSMLIPLVIILPIAYAGWVAVLIWKRGYLVRARIGPGASNRTATADRALRELAIYFLRIIGVFFVIWIPEIALVVILFATESFWMFVPGYCLAAIQPVVTFGFVLSKPDVRGYVRDLVTLSCLFGKPTTEAQQQQQQQPPPRRNANSFAEPSPQP